jgi:hypothetical protein
VRGRANLTDDRVRLLLDGHAPDDEPSLSQLAAFVRSARRHYVHPPSAGVAERHEAMIAAAARALPAEPAPSLRPRPRRMGAALRSHPRRAIAIAAAALALGMAGAWAVTDGGRQAAPTTSDRGAAAPVPERVVSPDRSSPPDEGEREHPRAPDKPHASPPAPTRVAPPPPVEQSLPVEPQPEALAERPPPEVEGPIDPKAPPHRGYGGPDSTPVPLEGPLDSEPKIPAPLEGPRDTEPQIPAPREGAPAP